MLLKSRFTLMTVSVLMVLALSAMLTGPVFADDGTPPPVEPTPEVVPPPVDEPAVVDVPPPATEESAPAAAPAEATVTEVLAQAPEGTDVQVVDENGAPLSLATQEAADVIENGDPIWCPVGVAPKASIGGCTASFISLQDLINQLDTNNPAKAGVIWIAYNYDNTAVGNNDVGLTNFTLDGDDFDDGDAVFTDTMDNFALTIKGGWSGVSGSTTINQNTPSVIKGASLSIVNWKAPITISDLFLDGNLATGNSGVNDSALLVETTGNIELDRVTVKNALNLGAGAMAGAILDNSSSTKASTVIVNNGSFEKNERNGLEIYSAGIITITSLIADGNDGIGAQIDNTAALTDKAVTLKGTQEYSYNSDDGLVVHSDGLVTISNIVSTGNGGDGLEVNNRTSLTDQGVTINGINIFNDNAVGMTILSEGALTLNNISATRNGLAGAILDNCNNNGTGCLASAKTVKLLGNNYFVNNTFDGLNILSFGAITLNNITAIDNGGNGADLNNQIVSFLTAKDSAGGITLTGYGVFSNNSGGDGLYARSNYNILLANVSANNNSSDGVDAAVDRVTPLLVGKVNVTAATITLTGLNFFTENGGDGLLLSADGKITLASITAGLNGDDGADLETTTLGSAVTLTGTNSFNDNGDTGLYVQSLGIITASNVAALYNNTGAALNNQFNLKVYAVTLSGTNSFNWNDSNGLLVDSYGAITINNLTANSNGLATTDSGAVLDNCDFDGGTSLCKATTASAVTLNGYVIANDNFYRGVQIDSLGAVTLNNVIATTNGNVGVRIQNQYNPLFNKAIVRGVTIKGTNLFNGNELTGLVVLSYGAISLNNINAQYNGDSSPGGTSGVVLNNEITAAMVTAKITAKNITFTGVNSFVGNYFWGLIFNSSGTVTLSRISANLNAWDGANGGGVLGSAKTITLTCGHMFGNGGTSGLVASGYELNATGVLTIKGIYSSGNGDPIDIATGSSVLITKACALP